MSISSKRPVYVVGHKNPDTDAICAAIGQAEFLSVVEGIDAQPIRCGDIPERTQWVLTQAAIESPELVTDVRTKAGEICRRGALHVCETDTFLSAYQIMRKHEVRAVPVVGQKQEVVGVLRYLDLLELVMPQKSGTSAVKEFIASPKKILEALEGESLGADVPTNYEEEELIFFVGASSEEFVRLRLDRGSEQGFSGRQVVITGDRPRLQATAIEHGVRAVVVTGGFEVEDQVLKLAQEKGVIVIRCSYDTATTVQLVRCSRVVKHAVERICHYVEASEAVSDLRSRLRNNNQDLFPVVEGNNHKLIGVLTNSDLIAPAKTKVVMVDHNEFSQAVKGINEANIIEVIDHHRLGGDVISSEPIRFLNEPVGSSCTLIARKFRQAGVKPTKGAALCMCAGLISDTLNLTSPTTTKLDGEILSWLSEIAGIEPNQFTSDFFAVGSLLCSATAMDAITTDQKHFEENRLTISQIEEVSLEAFDGRRADLEEALVILMKNLDCEVGAIAVTDITKKFSKIIVKGPEKVLDSIEWVKVDEGVWDAKGVVSRKKQILPGICRAINNSVGSCLS